MPDEEIRVEAKEAFLMARKYIINNQYNNALIFCHQGFDLISKLQSKIPGDLLNLEDGYYSLAVMSFNTGKYQESARWYLQCTLLLNEALDKDPKSHDHICRLLIDRYIDMKDAFFHLSDLDNAIKASRNAVSAFERIKIKNLDELSIGNTKDNFARFNLYYERKLSGRSYLRSTAFKNFQQIIESAMQDVLPEFGEISLAEKAEIDIDINELLEKLNLAEKWLNPVQITEDQAIQDKNRRQMLSSLISLIQTYSKQGLRRRAKDTCIQAIKVSNSITSPCEQDEEIGTKIIKMKERFSRETSLAMVPRSVFFAQERSPEEPEMDIEGDQMSL